MKCQGKGFLSKTVFSLIQCDCDLYLCRCLPHQDLCLVVELQANSAEDSNDPTELFSKGWTKIDLFDVSNRLLSGR